MKKKLFLLFLFSIFILAGCVVQTSSIPLNLDENSIPRETNAPLKTGASETFPRAYDDIQINDYTTNDQFNPSVCALSSDRLAVAWDGEGNGDPNGVYASVFDANTGKNVTREFRVNNYTTSSQSDPSICALSSDRFAVAWISFNQDLSTNGVYASVFDANTGKNVTREFRVNYNKTDAQKRPSICALSSDKFAVAWQSEGQDGDGEGVYARVFNATTGKNVTREFRVNSFTSDNQQRPSICALSSDIFAVAWQSPQDDSLYGVYARLFNATTGKNVTREFRVNSFTSGNQLLPSICNLSSDRFAVAWQSYGQDVAGTNGIYASVFNATTGKNVTREFRVNYNTTNDQEFPSICALSSDMFAVAWHSNMTDGSKYGVYATVFGTVSEPPSSPIAPEDDDDDDDDDDEAAIPGFDLLLTIITIGIVSTSIIVIIKRRKM